MAFRGKRVGKVPVYITYKDSRSGKTYEKRVLVNPDKAHLYPQVPQTKAFKPQMDSVSEFHPNIEEPENQKRKHTHILEAGKKPVGHEVGEIHSGDYANSEHRDEVELYREHAFGEQKPHWTSSLKVRFFPDKQIKIKDKAFTADIFHHPKVGLAYIVDRGLTFNFIVPKYNINKPYSKEINAEISAQQFFSDKLQKAEIFDKINVIYKTNIIERINNLQKSEDILISNYKSGDNQVSIFFNQKNNIYKVVWDEQI